MGEYDYSQIILLLLHYYYYIIIIIILLLSFNVCIGNYTVREVLMKNRTRVTCIWRNTYNTPRATHSRYFAVNISPNTSEIFH